MKMKIAFDISPTKTGHQNRGIGIYVKNLLAKLKISSDIQVLEFYDQSEIKEADIIHYPYFDLFKKSLPLSKKFPTVVTIHDVIPLIFPEKYPPGIKGRINLFYQKLSLKNTQAILTDSYSSKKDINQYLNINEKKIFPIYLAPREEFKKNNDIKLLSSVINRYNLPKSYALYVGDVNWNKNLINLTKACINADLNLVLIGGGFKEQGSLNHPELKSVNDFLTQFSRHPNIHILGYIPTKDLVLVMNLAKCLLLPSFYEGFGLPILEAQVCGIPVITSETSSMPEIGGSGALYVDPNNLNELTISIRQLVNDQSLQDQLVIKGSENVKNFSWTKTALGTIGVYNLVLSRRNRK